MPSNPMVLKTFFEHDRCHCGSATSVTIGATTSSLDIRRIVRATTTGNMSSRDVSYGAVVTDETRTHGEPFTFTSLNVGRGSKPPPHATLFQQTNARPASNRTPGRGVLLVGFPRASSACGKRKPGGRGQRLTGADLRQRSRCVALENERQALPCSEKRRRSRLSAVPDHPLPTPRAGTGTCAARCDTGRR